MSQETVQNLYSSFVSTDADPAGKKVVLAKLDSMFHKKVENMAGMLFDEHFIAALRPILVSVTDVDALLVPSLKVLNNTVFGGTSTQLNKMVDDENLAVILVDLLQSPSQVVLEHAVWVMDNLVLDYGHCRKRVLEAGFLDKLDPVIDKSPSTKVLQKLMTVLEHLTPDGANKVTDAAEIAHKLIPLFGFGFTSDSSSPDIKRICSKGMVQLLATCTKPDHDQDADDMMVDLLIASTDLLSKLVELVRTKNQLRSISLSVLLSISEVASSSQLQVILHSNQLLVVLKKVLLLSNSDPELTTMACQILSNICGGSEDVLALVESANIIASAIMLANGDATSAVKEAAACVLVFWFHGSTSLQARNIVQKGGLLVVINLLDPDRSPQVSDALVYEALLSLTKLMDGKLDDLIEWDEMAEVMEVNKCWEYIAALRESGDKKIHEQAVILDRKILRETMDSKC